MKFNKKLRLKEKTFALSVSRKQKRRNKNKTNNNKKKKTRTTTKKIQMELSLVSPRAETLLQSLFSRLSLWEGFMLVFWERFLLLLFSGQFPVVEMCLEDTGGWACCNGSSLHLVALFSSFELISVSGLKKKIALFHSLVSRAGSFCPHRHGFNHNPVSPTSISSLPSPCLCLSCLPNRWHLPPKFYHKNGCVSKPIL